MPDDYTHIAGLITEAQNAVYNLASTDTPDHNQKAWLQPGSNSAGAASTVRCGCVRQITGQPGPDTRTDPTAPFYGAHRTSDDPQYNKA